jgi:hypothetical protein
VLEPVNDGGRQFNQEDFKKSAVTDTWLASCAVVVKLAVGNCQETVCQHCDTFMGQGVLFAALAYADD